MVFNMLLNSIELGVSTSETNFMTEETVNTSDMKEKPMLTLSHLLVLSAVYSHWIYLALKTYTNSTIGT